MNQLGMFPKEHEESVFLWWSAGHLGTYPLDPARLCAFYAAHEDWMPKTMEDDGRVAGSMLMRRREDGGIHFGFIVVDSSARGKGYGSGMLRIALDHAFHALSAKYVSLNVFAHNAPAIRCYERLGFVRGETLEIEVSGEKRRAYRYDRRRNHG